QMVRAGADTAASRRSGQQAIARAVVADDLQIVRAAHRARLYRPSVRSGFVLLDLSRHPSLRREEDRFARQLPALGLRRYRRRRVGLAALLRDGGRTSGLGRGLRRFDSRTAAAASSPPAPAPAAVNGFSIGLHA